MKIAVYSPYLDTAGGGEKYVLTIAEALSGTEQVDILLDNHLSQVGSEKISEKIKFLHGIDLTKANFIKAPLGLGSFIVERLFFLKKYDWIFYLTDGSIFLSSAKNSVIHFQVPFENKSTGLWNKIKLSSWKFAIYNSDFTKQIVEKTWNIQGQVVYPPVSVSLFKPLKKKNQIVSVGRFFGYLKDKKQELMISIFKELVDAGKLSGWSLHLAGGAGEGDMKYVDELRKSAEGYRVVIHPNAPLDDLKKLYGESSIYWHAMGFGESDPKKFEHFGITTVEAMSAGCVPVVVNLGGQREIVQDRESGILWNTKEELKEMTCSLIDDQKLLERLSQGAQQRSRMFSKEIFELNIRKLVEGVA